ncbi:tRNA pseudouridine(55) synthase TruB [Stratiformator vulcanicus]|uniref:tRNA pseudouridine synthase B n=1 Tax=Stratiformator vulcanicus TaxID=2527980 RepID=A0A517R153_9PLAN|nr:tRNA pseudouridine(55) synthase TruB [Stratiformator vulcanicus]QDT37625.1 tRNA pseudouridine synthase B [Stratiformator vulcanicus]
MSSNFCGLLNINKPAGLTSRAIVDRAQRVLETKAGHAGTLDPLATGVVIVCLGTATRLIPFVQRMPKTYRATFRFGCRTDSLDLEFEPEEVGGAEDIGREKIIAALPQFLGEIEQTPPAYSAVRVDGQRAYKKVRAGREVEMPTRTVEVYRFELLSWNDREGEFEIECGSGTYIRSLCRDLAAALGTQAVMTSLVRTSIGQFELREALDPTEDREEKWAGSILQPIKAVGDLQKVAVDPTTADRLRNGQRLEFHDASAFDELAVIDPAGNLICIAEHDRPEQTLRPRIVFKD